MTNLNNDTTYRKRSGSALYTRRPSDAAIKSETGEDADIASRRGYGSMSSKWAFDEYQNPDDLVGCKGLDVYDRMMGDATVWMAVNSKKFAVTRSDWDVQPASNSKPDKDIAAFCKYSLEWMHGSLISTLFDVQSAIHRGYSIAEMNFETIPSGKWAGKWGMRTIRAKNPRDFKFDIDKYGNLKNLILVSATSEEKTVPLWKYIFYTYQSIDGRPWGRSDLRAAYKHYWSKDFLMKWWNIYMERHGAPTRVAKYPRAHQGEKEKLLKVLKKIVNNTAITIPDDIDIEFLATKGEAAFRAAIEYHDEQIVKAVLGQILTSGTGKEGGGASYALGNIHRETLEDYVNFIRRDLAESVMREQVLRQLVRLNFGAGVPVPRFVWRPRCGELQVQNVEEAEKLANMGVLVESDINPIIRRQLGLPASPAFNDDSDKIFVPATPMAGVPVPGNNGPGGGTGNGNKNGKGGGKDNGSKKNGNDGGGGAGGGNGKPGSKKSDNVDGRAESEFAAATDASEWEPNRVLFEAEQRIGGVSYFRKQINQRNKLETGFMTDLRPSFESARDSFKLQTRKTLRDPNGDLNKMKFPAGDLKELKSESVDYYQGITINEYVAAMKEVGRTGEYVPDKSDFNLNTDSIVAEFAKVNISVEAKPPEDALDQIGKWKSNGEWDKILKARERAVGILGAQEKIAAEFWITQIADVDILNSVKNTIFNGVRNNLGEKEIIDSVGEVFEKYIYRGEQVAPELLKAYRIENIVRTSTTRAFNDARRLAQVDPDVLEDFPGTQYSAVMDERTTVICSNLDGSLYRANDPIWDSIKPPNHFNCRSTTISVIYNDTRLEEKGFSDPPDLRIIPKGFGGLK